MNQTTSPLHDSPANRPTLPDSPASRARPGRTIVGLGPYDGAVREMVDDPDGTPEAVHAVAFQPSAYARDPGLGPAESIRLPRRRVEAADWLLLLVIIALVMGVLAALF